MTTSCMTRGRTLSAGFGGTNSRVAIMKAALLRVPPLYVLHPHTRCWCN